jgi:two-component system NtrC family response regulator
MNILLIDDEATQRESLKGFLEHIGHTVRDAPAPAEGLKQLDQEVFDVVMTDFRMPGMNGLDVVKNVKERNPLIDIILMTAYGDIDLAVNAMKSGAYDFLTKPIDLDQLELMLEKIDERRMIVEENRRLRESLEHQISFDEIVSTSTAMEKVLNLAARIADSTSSVLIRGETGVGKELVARAIHYASPRSEKPFVAVNCSALNEHLLESELFGHEKGAFTGALTSRAGRFEIASGGTLFLDEIGDLPSSVQVKLLRAIQEKTIERVGSNKPVMVDVRLITATHRDLQQEMTEQRFREDLYYRLNVVTIWVPPLRDRRDDIKVLADSFLKKHARERHKTVKGFTPEALDLLMRYGYPGNVRELENAIERAVLLTRMEYIELEDLPEAIQAGGQEGVITEGESIVLPITGSLPEITTRLEKAMLFNALRECNGNQTKAAQRIGISEKSVRDRLKKWGTANPLRSES